MPDMSVDAAGVAAAMEIGWASIVGVAATCVAGSAAAVVGALGEQAAMARVRAETAVVERIRASMG
jgi:hypothetical protein